MCTREENTGWGERARAREKRDVAGPCDEQGPYDEDRMMSKDRRIHLDDRRMSSGHIQRTVELEVICGRMINHFVVGHDLTANLNFVSCV